jgi:hypothetical protein
MTGKTIDREALHTEFALGVIAGEGSFYVTFAKDDRRRFGVTPGIRFQMNMGQFSESLLEWLAEAIGLGRVTKHGSGYSWTVSSRADCHALRSRIDQHLTAYDSGFPETPKNGAYERWMEALDIMRPGVQLTKHDLVELARLRDSINQIDSGSSRSAPEIIQLIRDSES